MDVVILGRVGYDLYSEEPHVPLPQVRRFSRYLGGSSANMAVGLSRLGAKVGLISCLGNDSLSEFLVDFLKKEKVETAHIQVAPGYLPSLCFTEVSPPDSFPQVFYRHDAVDTMLDAKEEDLAFASSSKMFITNGTSLCGSPSRESAYRALERAKQAGCTVVLDIDFRSMSWRSPDEAGLAIRLALPFVDVLIGNQLELKGRVCSLPRRWCICRRTRWRSPPPLALETASRRAFSSRSSRGSHSPTASTTAMPLRPSSLAD